MTARRRRPRGRGEVGGRRPARGLRQTRRRRGDPGAGTPDQARRRRAGRAAPHAPRGAPDRTKGRIAACPKLPDLTRVSVRIYGVPPGRG